MVQLTHKPILKQHPAISQLATTIKNIWHKQLMVFPYEVPTELGYVEGSLEGEQLVIQNLCYQTLQFRKLHLELAKVGSNLDILHCVMFPHLCFDLPIFGVDIVVARGHITAAIVDLSPVSPDGTLPVSYRQALEEIPVPQFSSPRALPEWGSIFSNHCLFVRIETPQEAMSFLNQVTQYLVIHCRLACESTKVEDTARASIWAGQKHYCQQQQKNDKTRRILERAFDKKWAQRYLETMLFDCASPDTFSP
ncbi:Ferredoxin-dependent bilin reductase superfamily [Synechococcus sp. PCC 7335]|uniref:phycocyanobilin:ferredoxin oxidoreductase n=1 Tax=Synechococcus sp. (strain ATCC 29403 / PCC 7335) TaxID=91464 RepID=UPI00017ECE0A|nr:phycocyanobilin:ferredoxin oxidoreductase [Synechococcus sp. PCC 7335]EDX84146.1 Ferredoxin-dependent bilin reductase superfamily [Synechococcus sp. PCC 7335]